MTLFFLSIPFQTVQAQTSLKRTYTATDVMDQEKNSLNDKCLELSIVPAIENQAPLIMFTLMSSPESKYGGIGVWYKKGESFICKSEVAMDINFKLLVLASTTLQFTTYIYVPYERFENGMIYFMNEKTEKGQVVFLNYSDAYEIMDIVSREVKRLNFPEVAPSYFGL